MLSLLLPPPLRERTESHALRCDYKYLWSDCFKLVVGSNLEKTIQQIMDMGGGSWDKDTVSHALRAA
ncbi:hypothetical protein JHK82_040363 [Glycine max]|nr:hypothetical protein JHK82_040363 [Glycine max]